MSSIIRFDQWQDTTGATVANAASGARLSISNNAVINGDFGIWQRGISFSFSGVSGGYTADRWAYFTDGTGSAITISQQALSAGEISGAGESAQFAIRIQRTGVGSGNTYSNLQQPIENVRTFANREVTLSFWAKADTNRSMEPRLLQDFGSGGSPSVSITFPSVNITTSWQRFTITATLPSLAGKTIGTNSVLYLFLTLGNQISTWDFWGVQLEAGPVATPFKPAGGGLRAAELMLCQRYYYESGQVETSYVIYNSGNFRSGTFHYPVTMRIPPVISVFDLAGTANRMTIINAGGGSQNGITPAASTDIKTTGWNYTAGGIGGSAGSSGNVSFSKFTASAEF